MNKKPKKRQKLNDFCGLSKDKIDVFKKFSAEQAKNEDNNFNIEEEISKGGEKGAAYLERLRRIKQFLNGEQIMYWDIDVFVYVCKYIYDLDEVIHIYQCLIIINQELLYIYTLLGIIVYFTPQESPERVYFL